ncbi:protein NEGATIVE GRAVITROPIC RESPONSE OF ROOTS-like [Lolium rigidum]|uniref:protein NEGATIVE GRAVITROPIC RESPONSE OF ROOTS-like n=1 Tax=Lolium rigidum TaxID=89674 RepID=UPI001F5CCDA5|nr:protein NEGATIVE GRAVITROPIC RESPONSE OF ROOTS-like [Lolium rigidum]
MGLINWVQNRLNTKQEKKRPAATAAAAGSSARNAPAREHFRDQEYDARDERSAGDWSMLSIGTLGNEQPTAPAEDQAVPDFTVEEVKKLQDALNKLLRRAKSKSSARGSTAGAGDDDQSLPLDRFLNCPSSLEVDRRLSLRLQAPDAAGQNGAEFSPDTQIILTKARELLASTTGGGGVKQKSFKFLLKKMFVCGGGFAPQPSFKDPVETKLEKLFRTMLHKKMSAARQSNAASSSRKYYLEDKQMEKIQMDGCYEEEDDNGEDVSKWDKTDSDFIVLEV